MKNSQFCLSLLCISLLSGCGNEEAPAPAAKVDQPAPPPFETSNIIIDGLSGSESYALRGADQAWPNGQADTLATDLNANNYYVIFDASGSMGSTECGDGHRRIAVAKQAIKRFFETLPKDSNLGLLAFSAKGVQQLSEIQPVNAPRLSNLTSAIVAGGTTPLADSMVYAAAKLEQQGQKQLGYGEYNIVVLTDGVANDPKDLRAQVSKIVANTPINIHTIGFCIGSDHSLNQQGIINYHPASNADELLSGLTAVLAEAPQYDSDHFDNGSAQ